MLAVPLSSSAQTVGDAISDMLMVEAILALKGMTNRDVSQLSVIVSMTHAPLAVGYLVPRLAQPSAEGQSGGSHCYRDHRRR